MTFYHHRLDRESTVKARLLVRPLTVLTFSECCSTFAVKPWKVTKVFHIVQKSVTKNFIWDWHFCLTSLNWVIGLKCAIIDSWFQVIYRSLISSGFLYREIFHCDSFFCPLLTRTFGYSLRIQVGLFRWLLRWTIRVSFYWVFFWNLFWVAFKSFKKGF